MSNRMNYNQANNVISTPADIDGLVAVMNRMDTCKEIKKLLVYINERRVYRDNSDSRDYLNFCLASYFVLNANRYEKFYNALQLMPLSVLHQKTSELYSFMPGINQEVLDLIKLKYEYQPKSNRAICMILDEFTIIPGVTEIGGRPYGIVDDGITQAQTPAKFVTQIWISSLEGRLIKPLVYYFTSQPATPTQLKSQIFECITKLNAINLEVVVLNTKLRLNFLELSELLGVGPDKQTFKVGEKEVVFVFDAPHMMIVTRNNLMKHSLKMEDGGQTSWKHIKTFFVKECESDQKKTKLTEQHIQPIKYDRTLPSLAIEVLSNTVSREMIKYVESGKLPTEALATAEYIALFDRLFDILNVVDEMSRNEFNSAYKGTKRQKQYLKKVMRFLETLKVFDNKGEEKTGDVKFIKAWLTTIRGVMKLWDIVKYKGHQFLLTKNIFSETVDEITHIFKVIFSRGFTASEFYTVNRGLFHPSYFIPMSLSPIKVIDMKSYAELIYERIPAVRHNLENDTQLNRGDSRYNYLKKDFLRMFFDMFQQN